MKLRISATDRNLANWNLSRLGGTRKYNVDFVNELTVLNESSSSRVLLFPVDCDTHDFFCRLQSNVFEAASLFQINHVVL